MTNSAQDTLKPWTICIGKKHALKKYDQLALNTSCFWESTGSNITPVVQFHENLVAKTMNKLNYYYYGWSKNFVILPNPDVIFFVNNKKFVKQEFKSQLLVPDRVLPRFLIFCFSPIIACYWRQKSLTIKKSLSNGPKYVGHVKKTRKPFQSLKKAFWINFKMLVTSQNYPWTKNLFAARPNFCVPDTSMRLPILELIWFLDVIR